MLCIAGVLSSSIAAAFNTHKPAGAHGISFVGFIRMLSDLSLGAGRDLQGLVSGEVARHQNVDDSRAVRHQLQRTADCAVFFAPCSASALGPALCVQDHCGYELPGASHLLARRHLTYPVLESADWRDRCAGTSARWQILSPACLSAVQRRQAAGAEPSCVMPPFGDVLSQELREPPDSCGGPGERLPAVPVLSLPAGMGPGGLAPAAPAPSSPQASLPAQLILPRPCERHPLGEAALMAPAAGEASDLEQSRTTKASSLQDSPASCDVPSPSEECPSPLSLESAIELHEHIDDKEGENSCSSGGSLREQRPPTFSGDHQQPEQGKPLNCTAMSIGVDDGSGGSNAEAGLLLSSSQPQDNLEQQQQQLNGQQPAYLLQEGIPSLPDCRSAEGSVAGEDAAGDDFVAVHSATTADMPAVPVKSEAEDNVSEAVDCASGAPYLSTARTMAAEGDMLDEEDLEV